MVAVVMHVFNPSTWEAGNGYQLRLLNCEAGGTLSSEFEASLVSRAISRTA